MSLLPRERRLILFGRYPVPGRTKTRLIPVLGPLGAAELHRRLTERTLATLKRAFLAPVDFAYTGGTQQQMRRWLGHSQVSLVQQPEGGLGRRMQILLERALAQGAQEAILVGTDVPELTSAQLSAAFDALASNDVVLGPSKDGGYWLVGCRRRVDIFNDISWGTPEVLPQTLAAAERLGLKVHLLPVLNDIDTEADLDACQLNPKCRRPYLSVVIPTINEAGRIQKTIEQLSSPDIEVVVADGGSRDETRELAQEAGATVITAQRGRAGQQNAGARHTTGQVLMFLHADTRLPEQFGEHIFELLIDPTIVLGAFQFKTDYEARLMRSVERAANLRAKWLHLPYGDQALFMRPSIFSQVGGFPKVAIAEDLFLVKAVSALGRIALTEGQAITSGRRWREMGVIRTTAVNYLVAAGCLMGIDPGRLAPLYRPRKRQSR